SGGIGPRCQRSCCSATVLPRGADPAGNPGQTLRQRSPTSLRHGVVKLFLNRTWREKSKKCAPRRWQVGKDVSQKRRKGRICLHFGQWDLLANPLATGNVKQNSG